MVNEKVRDQESNLRERLNKFLANGSAKKRDLVNVLHTVRDQEWNAVIFGGTLRDLMLGGAGISPRDVDIVVHGASMSQISDVFSEHFVRPTRFGGLHLNVKGWMFDVWPLSDTWAFREGGLRTMGFSSLPKTTFLNVEAVAARIGTNRGRPRAIFTHGFFEGIRSRTIDINYEPNPYPTLCVIRSLVTAARLGFKIAPRLAAYISHYAQKTTVDELLAVQITHYGRIRCDADEIARWLSCIAQHQKHSRRQAVALPVDTPRQHRLWGDPQVTR